MQEVSYRHRGVRIFVTTGQKAGWAQVFCIWYRNGKYPTSVVCFLLGNSPASEFDMPTFRNTLFHLHRQVVMKNTCI